MSRVGSAQIDPDFLVCVFLKERARFTQKWTAGNAANGSQVLDG